jgi:hypothetical protein
MTAKTVERRRGAGPSAERTTTSERGSWIASSDLSATLSPAATNARPTVTSQIS